MRYLLIGLMLALSVLTACGAEDDKGNSNNLAGRNDSNATAQPAISSLEPATVDVEGMLLYMQGDSLYRWQSDEPDLLASNIVLPLATTFSPDHKYMLYSTSASEKNLGGSGPFVEALELATDEKHPLLQFRFNVAGSTGWIVESWSEDGQWAIINGTEFSSGTSAVKLDGSVRSELSQGFNKAHFWLEGGQVVVASRDFNAEAVEIDDLDIVNVETGEVTEPDVEYPIGILGIRRVMEELGYELVDFSASAFFGPVPTTDYRVRPPFQEGTPRYCGDWQVVNETSDPVVTLHQAGGITDLTVLDDGSLLFIGWEFPDCEFLATPHGQLIHFVDGEQQIIAEDLGSDAVRNIVSSFGIFWDGANEVYRYALAPDGQRVAWIGYEDQISTLYITDLETMETTPIATSSSEQGNGFSVLFWL